MSTDRDDLLLETGDGVLTITMNRPSRRNAFTPAMVAELGQALADADRDDSIGCVVLTGAGGHFSAGGDVKAFDENGGEGGGGDTVDENAAQAQLVHQQRTIGAMQASRTPIVAAVPGAAAGAGLGLALAAHLRIGTPRTVMATAFSGVGLSGDFGVAWLLDRLVGPARAAELLLLNPKLDAAACERLGLLNTVVEEDEFEATVREVAQRLATGPQPATRHILANVADASRMSLDEFMTVEVARHKECGLSEDHVAAVRAFVERQAAKR